MSLQVWLPLTKDLRNQGLSNVTVTNNGATFSTAGKLGGCYNVSESIGVTTNNITLGTTFSITCWLKINSYNKDWANAFKIYKDGYDYIGLCMNQASATTKQLGFHIYKNNGSNARTSVHDSYYMPLIVNTWYHLCFVVTPFEIKTYQNGVNIETVSITTTFPSVSNYNLGLGKSSQFNGLDCSLNDFRIYNNALSEKEIKEIAKGLVLHYLLNDKYIESTTNISTTVTAGTGSSGWGGHSATRSNYNATDDPVPFDQGTKIDITYSSGGGGFGCILDRKAVNASTTYTFSLYIKASDNFTYTHANFLYHYEYSSSGTTIKEFGVFDKSRMEYMGNGWYRIWGSFTTNAETATTSIYFFSYPGTNMTYWIGGWQLEQKDHITPFVTPGTSRNNSIVYDCSGFCNNGTISGALTISNDTPKYSYSIQMPAAATISHTRCLDNTNQEWSCAAWVKPTTNSNYQNLNNFNGANRLYHGTYPILYLNEGANDYYNYGNLALPVNQWSHIVFVFKNSTGTKLIYINGENHTNTLGPNKTSTPKGIPDTVIIGGGNYEGGLCDYREYATALSEKDVKSLYNNNAYIDSDGKIYGKIR